jgi:hypothetical protein
MTMKRTILTAAFTLALCGAADVWAQQVFKRVQFPPGRTSAVLQGSTNTGGGVVYQLRAHAGQHLILHLTSPKKDVKCQISPVYSELLPGAFNVTRWEGDLPKTGDYSILVFTERGSDTYTLEVTLPPGAYGQEGGTPVSDERPSDPSPPAQSKAEVGAYSGHYVLKDDTPRGFGGLEGFDLTTADFSSPTRPVPVKPYGLIYAGRKYRMTRVSIDGDHFSFETASVAGTSYQFDGKFLHPDDPDAPVLEGLLTKTLNGKTVAEARVKFITEEGVD